MPAKFLKSSDLQDLCALEFEGAKPLLESDESIASIVTRIPELKYFFAEPTITFDENGDLKSAKWYTEFDHEVRRLGDLTGLKKERAQENLDSKLNAAAQYLDDPVIGGLLSAMLNISSPDALCFVGTQPVLIDWGTVPRDQVQVGARDRLSMLFPAAFAAGALSATSASAVSEVSQDAAATLVGNGVDDDANTETFDMQNDEAGAADVDGNTSLVTRNDACEDLAHGNIIYVDNTPFYHRFWFRAALFSLIILLIIWLLWWLFFARPGGLLVPPPNIVGMHDSVVDGLTSERDRLRGLLEDPCAPNASAAIIQGMTGAIAPSPSGESDTGSGQVEGAVSRGGTNTPPRPSGVPGQMMAPETLAHQMERSVAFVLGSVPAGGVSMGSGFFIAPDIIVTNRHVIEEADPTKIAVTSEVIGQIRKAKIIAMTSNSEIGTSDYAVLKLSSAANIVPVPLSEVADKLSRVVAVGYPGYLTNMDPKLRQLMGGDMSAAPDAVFTSGEISVIQDGGNGLPIIIHTADMSQGNSGGPLVDQCGRVLGINTFIGQDDESGRRGLFALGVSDLMKFLDQNNVPYERAIGACAPAPAAEQGG